MDQEAEDEIQRIVSALSHPLRRRLLRWQRERGETPASPLEASEELKHDLRNTAYHVRFLAKAGLLREVEHLRRPVRGSVQHFYLLDPERARLPMVVKVLDGGS